MEKYCSIGQVGNFPHKGKSQNGFPNHDPGVGHHNLEERHNVEYIIQQTSEEHEIGNGVGKRKHDFDKDRDNLNCGKRPRYMGQAGE